jgi:hypothetical protein
VRREDPQDELQGQRPLDLIETSLTESNFDDALQVVRHKFKQTAAPQDFSVFGSLFNNSEQLIECVRLHLFPASTIFPLTVMACTAVLAS